MKLKFNYDLIAIGSGAAGSAAALMATGAGLRVALVEADKWGGSAINYSDVPFSALFHATHLLDQSITGAKFGISSTNLRYNYPTLNNWKNIAMRRAGADSKKSFENAGITCLHGFAHFLSPYEISVGPQRISAKKFLIATGSEMIDTGIKIPENLSYLTPDSILQLVRPPKTLFIAGAGSTGCELAQYFAELGTKVLIADIAGRLLPREDEEVGQVFDDIFNRLGIKVLTQSRVVSLEKDSISKKVVFLRGGQEKSVRIDEILLCTGSTPATDFGLENAGVKFTNTGIKVEKNMQTSVKHIYAAGDVIGGTDSSTEKSVLESGIAMSHMINHSKEVVNYSGLTRITRTWPSIATIGATEDDCLRHDRKVKKVIVPLATAQVSNTSDFRDGFVKIITDRSNKIIGATIIAPQAGIMAQELALAIRYEMTPRDIANTPHIASDWGEVIRIACRRLA
ncbi:MAG: NAD(P)/FAD-dependent oxidoreductase [Candidatus Nomurabacteria bacterium]|jgi:dihydrolipoamide dehydrogenase|nr:NAD(P)/FAD-dependent oxidoreductase [Candidatus Nomurabacteria bacterium]